MRASWGRGVAQRPKVLTRDEARCIAANIAKDAGLRHSLVIFGGLSR
jgi:hypothetical protein